MKLGYVYITTNKEFGTLYIGVTSNLSQRISQHKEGIIEGFTSAIVREKQLKGGNRKSKILLIESINKEWNDLYETIVG